MKRGIITVILIIVVIGAIAWVLKGNKKKNDAQTAW